MKGGKNDGPKAPILFRIDGGEDAGDAAEREAWRQAVAGFEAALSVSGLTPEARAAFVNRLRLARECAGLPARDLRPARELDA